MGNISPPLPKVGWKKIGRQFMKMYNKTEQWGFQDTTFYGANNQVGAQPEWNAYAWKNVTCMPLKNLEFRELQGRQ